MSSLPPSYRRVWLVLMFLALLLGTVSPTLTVPAQAPGLPLELERNVFPAQSPQAQGEFTVQLTLKQLPHACATVVSSKPAEIVLVMDRSGSMDDASGSPNFATKLDAAKAAAKAFIKAVDLKRNRIGLVQFNDAADTVISLNDDVSQLTAAVNSLSADGGTAIDQGIVLALQELQMNRRPDTNGVVVLLSDGDSDEQDALKAAEVAKQDDVRLITIGLGQDANQSVLQQIASGPDDVYFSPDAGQLEKIYQDIAITVSRPLAVQNIVLEHTFDATSFQVVPDSISPKGTLSGGKISWSLKEVPAKGQVFSYKARPLASGGLNLDQGDTIRFKLCEDSSQVLTQPAGLPVQVLPPTPTPMPTLTPTPLPTPVPTPTLTPRQQFVGGLTDSFCESFPWWLFCLLGLLLLLCLWYIFKRLRAEMSKPEDQRRCYCNLIPLLLLPLLVIFLGALLHQFQDAFCAARESVYFWRIGSAQTGIFFASANGSGIATEFKSVNQSSQCVGCHSVSSTSRMIAAISGSGVGTLEVYSLDGQRINIPNIQASYASWSPDGTKLAISTGKADIYILDLQSKNLTPLAGASDPAIVEMMPSWGPNQRIAFVRATQYATGFRVDSPCDIYTISETGGQAEPLPGASGGDFNYYPAYSPDGRWLAFTYHKGGKTTYSDPLAEIYLVPAAGGKAIRLVANDDNGKPLQNASNSWPSWSLDGQQLAFNSKRNDSNFDVFLTQILTDGQSTAALPLAAASNKGIFEHLPFWGTPPQISLWQRLLLLWPWLIPFLLILLLWLLCRWLCRQKPPIPVRVWPTRQARPIPSPLPLLEKEPWQVRPALIVGVGGTGRWVLTHLKKTLLDGGLGNLPKGVHFVLVDTSERGDVPGEVAFAGIRLEKSEMFLIQDDLRDLIYSLARQEDPRQADGAFSGWFPAQQFKALGAKSDLAEGASYRPLAKAGLVLNLRGEPSRLWEMLVQNCKAVADACDGQVDIVLVGSLAGGMSGMVTDLAYLAKAAKYQATGLRGTVRLEGFFTSAEVQNLLGGNLQSQRIDMFATLRELGRFQLADARPHPMHYQAVISQELPDGEQDGRLLDDIFLFSRHISGEPWATVFASMADIIALRLDSQAAASWSPIRRAVSEQALNSQQAWKDIAVGTAGSYVYRFPVQDMLEQVKTRWASALVWKFLNDKGVVRGGISVEDAAKYFWQGQLGCGKPPDEVRTFVALINGQQLLQNEKDVLERVHVEDSDRKFALYLGEALKRILNGVQEDSAQEFSLNALAAGRITFAENFVNQVRSHLKQAEHYARGLSMQAAERDRPAYNNAVQLAQHWQKTLDRLAAVVVEQNRLLSGDEERSGQISHGVYKRLQQREADAKKRRIQMDKVVVRKYLWERIKDPSRPLDDPANRVDLAQEWYEQYVDGHIDEYLDRLYWKIEPSGEARLALYTYNQQGLVLDADNVDVFVNEILRLADYVVRDVWKNASLVDMLRDYQIIGENASVEDELSRIWPLAQPYLQKVGDNYVYGSAAGVTMPVQNAAPQLCDALRNPARVLASGLEPVTAQDGAKLLTLTDRYALMLVRTLDLLPALKLPEMQRAQDEYINKLGLGTLDASEMTAVFAAEHNALNYECRLARDLYMGTRTFNPYIILAFEHLERLKLYGLAFAAGWVTDEKGTVVLMVGEQKFILGQGSYLDARVVGLLNFCQKTDQYQDVEQELRKAFDPPAPATKRAWKKYAASWQEARGVPEKLNQDLIRDLAAVAALCMIDQAE